MRRDFRPRSASKIATMTTRWSGRKRRRWAVTLRKQVRRVVYSLSSSSAAARSFASRYLSPLTFLRLARNAKALAHTFCRSFASVHQIVEYAVFLFEIYARDVNDRRSSSGASLYATVHSFPFPRISKLYRRLSDRSADRQLSEADERVSRRESNTTTGRETPLF